MGTEGEGKGGPSAPPKPAEGDYVLVGSEMLTELQAGKHRPTRCLLLFYQVASAASSLHLRPCSLLRPSNCTAACCYICQSTTHPSPNPNHRAMLLLATGRLLRRRLSGP